MLKRLATLLALALSITALSGCIAITGVAPSQSEIGEPVRIQVTFCVTDRTPSGAPDHPGCDDATNDADDILEGFTYQALLGFRLPEGVAVPEEFASTSAPELTFAFDESYSDELERLAPAGPGQVWAGYISNGHQLNSYPAGEPAREATVAPEFDLPEMPDGAPFPGPFHYRVVAGGRQANGTTPVQCGDGPTGGATVCLDSPLIASVASNSTFVTSDAGIVAGSATVSPGQSVALPFFVRVAGNPGAGRTASLSASTTLQGAAVAPQPAGVPLALNGNERVEVPVTVPANAAPGDYEVRLDAQLPGGATRSAAGRLTVRALPAPAPPTPPTPQPDLAPKLSKTKLSKAGFRAGKGRRRGTTIAYALSEPARVRFAVQRCAKGKGCRRPKAVGAFVKQGRAGGNRFRFSGIVKGRRLKPGRYRLTVTATDSAGNSGSPRRIVFTVRR